LSDLVSIASAALQVVAEYARQSLSEATQRAYRADLKLLSRRGAV